MDRNGLIGRSEKWRKDIMIRDHAYRLCTNCGKVDYHGNLEDRREEGYYHLPEVHHIRGQEIVMHISQESPSLCDECFREEVAE